MSAGGNESIDTTRKNLLANAKREAVNEIFGELITSFTKVDKGILTEDDLKLASVGYIRIKGNPIFKNGENFGEVCVSIDAYANDNDMKNFDPIHIENKYCGTNPDFTTRQVKTFARDQSIINALIKYNRNLESHPEKTLLKLVHEVKYVEEGFIPETETYCAKMKGVFYPVEVAGLLSTHYSENNNHNLSGDWSYYNGRGYIKVTDDGENVNMEISWLPKGGVMPHYVVSAVKSGDLLKGTWQCVSRSVRNCPTIPYPITIQTSNNGKSMVTTFAEDPYNFGWNKRAVWTKK